MNNAAFYKLSYGVYIVSSAKDDKPNGQIANTVFQVTSEPPAIAICINKENLTYEYLQASKKFSISVIEQDTPMTFIGRFGFRSGRDINKFEGISYIQGKTGIPVVTDYTLAYLELEITSMVELGTHSLFIGNVVESEVIKEGEPMTYAYYHQVKKGRSPKTAPTYIKPGN